MSQQNKVSVIRTTELEAVSSSTSWDAATLEEMQKHLGWTIAAITSEGITIVSPDGELSELITASHTVWDYGDKSEGYLNIGENSIIF
jgi:hypothetical protein